MEIFDRSLKIKHWPIIIEHLDPIDFGCRMLNADYLNTSLNCIQNNYNRHKTQLKNALNLLQPVTKEMGEMFEEFKSSSMRFIEDAMKEAPKKFNRYVRKTLDMEQHRADYAQWHTEFEAFQKENPSYPSFDEVYGKVVKKRKRVKGILQFEGDLSVMENGMQSKLLRGKIQWRL
jgi:hypothetical protein